MVQAGLPACMPGHRPTALLDAIMSWPLQQSHTSLLLLLPGDAAVTLALPLADITRQHDHGSISGVDHSLWSVLVVHHACLQTT